MMTTSGDGGQEFRVLIRHGNCRRAKGWLVKAGAPAMHYWSVVDCDSSFC
jgi:hypothetical protein